MSTSGENLDLNLLIPGMHLESQTYSSPAAHGRHSPPIAFVFFPPPSIPTSSCKLALGFGGPRELDDGVSHLKNQTVIAIEASRASFVEVPVPDEDIGFCQKQYRLIVRSTTGPIGVYLLIKNEKKSMGISVNRTKLSSPLSWAGSRRTDDADLPSTPSDTSTSSKLYGARKIVPLYEGVDGDYWLRSEHASTSDLWS